MFATLALGLDFFYLTSLISLEYFPCLKTPLDLQIFKLISYVDPSLNLLKPDNPE
jgi:hypothetical protein